MKIATGNMVNLPYTSPRTQLSVIELEEVCAGVTGSKVPSQTPISNVNSVSVNSFDPQQEETITGSGDWGNDGFTSN